MFSKILQMMLCFSCRVHCLELGLGLLGIGLTLTLDPKHKPLDTVLWAKVWVLIGFVGSHRARMHEGFHHLHYITMCFSGMLVSGLVVQTLPATRFFSDARHVVETWHLN